VHSEGHHSEASHVPRSTLYALEQTIKDRKAALSLRTGVRHVYVCVCVCLEVTRVLEYELRWIAPPSLPCPAQCIPDRRNRRLFFR
jgi:hypothetical protein